MELEEMKQLLEKAKQERINKVQEGINKVLNENKCRMEVSLMITEKGNQFIINIIPLE
jgi:hypothetical protein